MVKPTSNNPPKPENGSQTSGRVGVWLLLVALLAAGTIAWMSREDFIIWKEGKPELSPDRKEKLAKELDELDRAEQYVLLAERSGVFPCYSCPNSATIHLNKGEVWKYGTTTKGQYGRYPGGLPVSGLYYFKEYEGPLQECLKQEKLKIYHYALLPENLIRIPPLIRPPGNKMDK